MMVKIFSIQQFYNNNRYYDFFFNFRKNEF